jgi:hypothetical protein
VFPNRVPMDTDTLSTEPLVYLFIHSFVRSFIHSCMSAGVPRSPQKGALLHTGKNIRSPSKEPHADGRPTYNRVRPGPPRGSLTTLLSLPQCHAAFGMIPSTLAWVDQSPISQRVIATACHMTQGGVQIYDNLFVQYTVTVTNSQRLTISIDITVRYAVLHIHDSRCSQL